MIVLWLLNNFQDQETASERDRVLNRLSSLDFHDKQKDVFRKHHQGTGQWLLGNDKFREWSSSNQNSILWCPGIRTSTAKHLVITF